ncbi:MAG: hypothetical protein JXA96_01240 [Sedimentisphaerales bacterium]|nr:hypothetical protein [Sedimentisphaerales bacterium]
MGGKIFFIIIVLITVTSLPYNSCMAEYNVYSLGQSYTVDCGYIQSFADEAGINLKAGSCYKGNMRNHASASKNQEPYSELSSGTVDIFLMSAHLPYKYSEPEAEACAKMGKVLLENNPHAKLLIHDYWTVARPSAADMYNQLHGWDNVKALCMGGIKTTYLITKKLNYKVYNSPVGIAIQLLREKIEQGELEDYKNTDELMSDEIHLSEIGRYVQACMCFCSAYQYDIRKLPGEAVNKSGSKIKFSKNDAKIIHDIIYNTVRNTPYSGWYKNEPESIDEYLKHLENGLKNCESFDNLYPDSGTGTFTGDNGIIWNYANIRSVKDTEILTDTYIEMDQDSSISATIPDGIGDLHFNLYRGSEIEVFIGVESMGTFKAEDGDRWECNYLKITGINKPGNVRIRFVSKNDDTRLDNIFWTAPE